MKKQFIILGFKLYGFLRGSQINSCYQSIREYNNKLSLIEKDQVSKYLLSHGYMADLKSAPITGKQELTSKLAGIDPSKIKSYIYTGGSYGEPFKLPYSKEREMVRTATFRYFNEIAGYQLGDPYLLIAAKPRPYWSQFLRNEYRFVPRQLTPEKIAEVIELICKKKIPVIIGFSSVIADLAVYLAKHQLKTSVRAIIFTSEPVDETKAKFIREVFNCSVTDRYSNEEVGLIAQQRTYGGVYYTNRYNILVEILDENLNPVKVGEMGRVVVTDLRADLIPLVRYDTGDLAVAHEYQDGQLLSLKCVAGRVAERIYTPEGQPVAPLAFGPLIHKPMTTAECYNQFQFAQTGVGSYELRIKDGDTLPEGVLQVILSNLGQVLGNTATVTVKSVADIPPLKSGKRPIYVNEWSNLKGTTNV